MSRRKLVLHDGTVTTGTDSRTVVILRRVYIRGVPGLSGYSFQTWRIL